MTINWRPQAREQSILDLYACFLTVALLIIAALLLGKMVPNDAPVPEAVRALFIDPRWLQPEAKERTIFVVLTALLLPLSYIAIKLVILLNAQFCPRFVRTEAVIAVPVVFILIVPWIGMLVLFALEMRSFLIPACITGMLAVTAVLTLRPVLPKPSPALARFFSGGMTLVALLAIVISVLSYRVQSISQVTDETQWTDSFEAVFYSVSQIAAGKTLLADLPAQYGMYAEILKPIFSLTGLSVLSFTAVMSALEILGLTAILWLCRRLMKSAPLRLFAVFSFCVISGAYAVQNPTIGAHLRLDPFYQYWPLRFIFPALSLCALYALSKRKQRCAGIALMGFLAGLAIVWNLDSGIPVFGAFIAYLLLEIAFPVCGTRMKGLQELALAAAVTLISVMSFAGYLQAKAAQTIHWQDLAKYQQIFYQAGYLMSPMPTSLSPWMGVIGIYIIGVTGALSSRIQRRSAPVWDVLFFTAILGLGLFSYYQGRSQIQNLMAASWPAILIAFILTDRTFRAIKVKLLPLVFVSTLLPVFLLAGTLTAVFIDCVPSLLWTAGKNIEAIRRADKTALTENVAFIREHTRNAESAVIYSSHQSVYFAETGLASVIDGPGIAEIMLKSDRDGFFAALRSKPASYLFIQEDRLPQIIDELGGHYTIEAKSDFGMFFLVPSRA